MSVAEAYCDEIRTIDEPTISSKSWASPRTSEFEIPPAKVLKFSRPEDRRSSRSTEYSISIDGMYPTWFPNVAGRLLFLMLNLQDNWDSYGARGVSRQSVETALALCSVMNDASPPPAIIPTPSGGVQLEWHKLGIDLEVDITNDGRYSISFDDETTVNEILEEESTLYTKSNYHHLLDRISVLTERNRIEEFRI